MLKFGLFLLLIIVLAVLRFKFDMKYTFPVIRENKDLFILNMIGYGVVAVIFISIVFKQGIALVISLIVGIPVLLYLNYKTYQAAIKKFFDRKS